MHMDMHMDNIEIAEDLFTFCDINNDGFLDETDDRQCEAKAKAKIQKFLRRRGINVPHDVQVAYQDALAARQAEVAEAGNLFFENVIDKNGDGKSSLMEIKMSVYCILRSVSQLLVEQLDTNGDGILNRKEFFPINGIIGSVTGHANMRLAGPRQVRRIIKAANKYPKDRSYNDREIAIIIK